MAMEVETVRHGGQDAPQRAADARWRITKEETVSPLAYRVRHPAF
jgi:hypothetical protein